MLTLALAVTLAAVPLAALPACPGELAPSAISVTQPPPGWTGFIPTRIYLNAIGISTGPLADRATLIGDYRKLPHGAFTVTYSLKGLEKVDRWIICQYGLGNEIVIGKLLQGAVDQCVVTYHPDKFGGTAIDSICR